MKQRNLLSLILAVNLICSCTITKRHFESGYHVEWNRKMKSGSDQEELPKMDQAVTDFASKENPEPDSIILKQLISEIPDVLTEEPIDDYNVFDESVQSEEMLSVNENRQIVISRVKSAEEPEIIEEPKSRMHPMMWGIWAAWSIAIACMFFVTFYAEALIGVALGFFIALIFALIVLKSLRKNPGKNRFKGLSYGFGIPAIVFGVIASAGLGLILVMFFFV